MAFMLLVVGLTAGGLYYAERTGDAADQLRVQKEFQGELGRQLGSQEARRGAIAERCQILAQSPRILAALEEGEPADLYLNAEVELRDFLENGWDKIDDGFPKLLEARGFRFLNAAGAVIPKATPGKEPESGSWESQLTRQKISPKQETGYLVVKSGDGQESLNEVIVTPIINRVTGESLGAIALFFTPVPLRAESYKRGMKSGILMNRHLYMPTHSKEDEAFVQSPAAASATDGSNGDSGTVVDITGEKFLAFANSLNPGSSFLEAQQLCFYPIAESLARRKAQQQQILAAGFVVLFLGLLASYFISSRLSKPVEQLAEDSAKNRAQRARAEAALQITERKYESIFENAIEGIFILSEEGRFITLNPALAAICGHLSPAAMLAALHEDDAILFGESGKSRFQEFLGQVRDRGSVFDFEQELLRANGGKIWASVNARLVPALDGVHHHFEGSMVDITERRRAADELRHLNEGLEKALRELKTTQQQIIQQERMRALGEMASGVAHDFNNALTPILGYTDLILSREGEIDQEIIDNLKTIRIAASDAGNVVRRLREFYRSTALGDHEFRKLDLNDLIRQTVVLTQPRWRQQAQSNGIMIEVETTLEPQAPPISGDASALREMLTNLIFNSVDAMPSGGVLTLSTQRTGKDVVLKVSDTGTGMSKETRQHCLEPFFSTKGERGTGLGLSMVIGIVQRHHGVLDLQSKPGEGTTFIISLPVAEESAPAAPASLEADNAAPHPALRLLVVDDEPPIRALLAAVLKGDGHNVVLANEGQNALSLFKEELFDLVITDKAMPEMNGDQLAKAIKAVSPRMPIILLTGFGEFIEAASIPDVDVLASKPFTLESLRQAISSARKKAA